MAIDCPGYGGSAGSAKTIRSDPLRLLQDVITALAKPHAYAIVGCSQGAMALLTASERQPGLCNFAVVRTPLAPADFAFCSRLLQHALVFDDEGADSARKLVSHP